MLDSGGAGYIYIARGILEGLLGHDGDFDISNLSISAKAPAQNLDADSFTRDSVFEEGYCTEFILPGFVSAQNTFKIFTSFSELPVVVAE